MKEKGKWTPHIIAAAALVVFIVLGLACASAPKPPVEIVYNPSIPEDQTATLLIGPGSWEVFEFDGVPLNPRWYQASLTSPGMNVKIPSGRHSITFHYYGGDGADARNKRLDFNTFAGRSYKLTLSAKGHHTRLTVKFYVCETSDSREPRTDEQLLFFKMEKGTHSIDIILDKDTDEERLFQLGYINELRIIVPKGEHTIDIDSFSAEAFYRCIEPC